MTMAIVAAALACITMLSHRAHNETLSYQIKANVAHKRHRLISKPKQMKRKARGTVILEKGDSKLVLTYMPYMRG